MSKKVLMLLTVLSLVAALVGGYVFDKRSKNRAKAAAEKSKETKPKTQKVMSEAERRAYVEKFIKIEDIKFGPDTHIGPD